MFYFYFLFICYDHRKIPIFHYRFSFSRTRMEMYTERRRNNTKYKVGVNPGCRETQQQQKNHSVGFPLKIHLAVSRKSEKMSIGNQ